MRRLPISAALVAILVFVAAFAGTADASIFAGTSKPPASAAKGTKGSAVSTADLYRTRRGHTAPAAGEGNSQWGATYRMAYDLLAAFQTRNYTWAASLISDDAMVMVSAIGCGMQTKQQLLAAAQNDGNIAGYFQFGSWAGYHNSSVAALGTTGAIRGPGTGEANQTFILNDVIFYMMPNEEGTQLSVVEQITDRSWAQPNNATAMTNVMQTLIDSVNLHDRVAFSNLFDEYAHFEQWSAWDQFPIGVLENRTSIVYTVTHDWPNQVVWKAKINFVHVNCEFVVASVTWSEVKTDGSAMIMNFLISLVVDEKMKVSQFTELFLMPQM